MIVVDASVVANAVGDDSDDGARTRAAIASDPDLAAPDLLDVETFAVFRRRWLAGDLTEARFLHAIDDLVDLPIDRYPTGPLMRRPFALRSNVTVYDACYVALAEALDATLRTADARLAAAPSVQCQVELIA